MSHLKTDIQWRVTLALMLQLRETRLVLHALMATAVTRLHLPSAWMDNTLQVAVISASLVHQGTAVRDQTGIKLSSVPMATTRLEESCTVTSVQQVTSAQTLTSSP
jgi:hypothetical protein